MATWAFFWWAVLVTVGAWATAPIHIRWWIVAASVLLPVLIIVAAVGKYIHSKLKSEKMAETGASETMWAEMVGLAHTATWMLQSFTFHSKWAINPFLYAGAVPVYVLHLYPAWCDRTGTLYGGPPMGTWDMVGVGGFGLCLLSLVVGIGKFIYLGIVFVIGFIRD
jgi:hypothetical protein